MNAEEGITVNGHPLRVYDGTLKADLICSRCATLFDAGEDLTGWPCQGEDA